MEIKRDSHYIAIAGFPASLVDQLKLFFKPLNVNLLEIKNENDFKEIVLVFPWNILLFIVDRSYEELLPNHEMKSINLILPILFINCENKNPQGNDNKWYLNFEGELKYLIEKVEPLIKKQVEIVEEQKKIICEFLEDADDSMRMAEECLSIILIDFNNEEALRKLYQKIHTIKGNSSYCSIWYIESFCHEYEQYLSQIIKKEIALTTFVVDHLYQGIDRLEDSLKALKLYTAIPQLEFNSMVIANDHSLLLSDKNEREESFDEKYQKHEKFGELENEKILVPSSIFNEFMELGGDLMVIRNTMSRLIDVIRREFSDHPLIKSLVDVFSEMDKASGQIQNKIVEIRKTSIKSAFRGLARLVRETAGKLGKKVTLSFSGEEIVVDKSIVHILHQSISHLIRNAIDHGIETKELRIKNGKNEEGLISIICRDIEEHVTVSIIDDGYGLDLNKIKEKALKTKLVSEDHLLKLSSNEIYALIFLPGFSTVEKVSSISGRGVGMDAVKETVESIGGTIEIKTELGKGTNFTLMLPKPKSVLLTQAIIVKVDIYCFGVYLDAVKGIERVKVFELHDGSYCYLGKRCVPIWRLSGLMKRELIRVTNEFEQLVIFIQYEESVIAGAIDLCLGQFEVVVQPVKGLVLPSNLIKGIANLDSSQMAIIIDHEKLLSFAFHNLAQTMAA